MERKINFASTTKETVEWAYETRVSSPIFLGHPKYDSQLDRWVIFSIHKMRKRGWDDDKILRNCSENLPKSMIHSPRIPLPEIIISSHPIVYSWEETDVRKALHKLALTRIVKAKERVFEILVDSKGEDQSAAEYREKEIVMLEGFIERLTQQVNPSFGIRNR